MKAHKSYPYYDMGQLKIVYTFMGFIYLYLLQHSKTYSNIKPVSFLLLLSGRQLVIKGQGCGSRYYLSLLF